MTTHPRGFDREIRFAVVMYGGVSLAVYMNGIAQELLNMVRATAPLDGDPLNGQFRWDASTLPGTERVYRELAETIRARFVVDIISGTSAGGINGIFLAKAIVEDRSLDGLRKLWVSQGDIAKLLNDRASLEGGLPPELLETPATSLLNGKRFYWQLLDALDSMDDQGSVGTGRPGPMPPKGRPPYVDEIDLFVTATDFQGLDLPLELADKTIDERVFRKLFHFRSSESDASDSGEPEARKDFGDRMNPMLAFAARCTASFPAAFPPFKLEDIDPVLEGHPRYAQSADRFGSRSPAWERFFAEYPPGYEKRFFVDGGYLDNKPFDAAVTALSERQHVLLPAERKLLYIEPDPDRSHRDSEIPRPDVVSALLAVDSLPRVETIRAELNAISRRNTLVARACTLTDRIEEDAQRDAKLRQPHKEAGEWARNDLQTLIEHHGLAYGGYHRLKVAALTDWLSECMARARPDRLTAESTKASIAEARTQVLRWRQGKYAENPNALQSAPAASGAAVGAPAAGPSLTEGQLLVDFDVAYRIRRMEFVRLKLRDALRSNENAQMVIALAGCTKSVEDEDDDWETAWNNARDELIGLQGRLQEQHQRLLAAQRECWQLDERCKRGTLSFGLAEALRAYQREGDPKAAALLEALGDDLRGALTRIGVDCKKILADGPGGPVVKMTRAALGHFYDQYDDFDLVRFPVAHCLGTSELEGIDVVRVSAADTTLAGSRGASKLAGVKLGHFGAFLDADWREADILWGRLDGAERIISTLAPAGSDEASRAAHEGWLLKVWTAIVREHIEEKASRQSAVAPAQAPVPAAVRPTPAPAQAVAAAPMTRTQIADYVERETTLKKLPAPVTIDLLGRSTAIVRSLLGGVAEKRGLGENVAVAWLLRLLAAIWGLVEVAIPRSVGQLLLRYWLQLVAISGGLLVVVAGLLNLPSERNIGVLILGTALVAEALGETLRVVISNRDRRPSRRALASLWGTAAVAGLALIRATKDWASGLLPLPGEKGPVTVPLMRDLELAQTAKRLSTVLGGCENQCQARLVDALHGDTFVILGYVLLLAGLALFARTFTAARGWSRWARCAKMCAYAVLIAGLADLMENAGLWMALHRQLWSTPVEVSRLHNLLAVVVPALTFGVSTLKWGLLFVTASFNVIALVAIGGAALANALGVDSSSKGQVGGTSVPKARRPRLFVGHGKTVAWRAIELALGDEVEIRSLDVLSKPNDPRSGRLLPILDGCDFAVVVSSVTDGAAEELLPLIIGLVQGRVGPDRFRLLAADKAPPPRLVGVARIDFTPERSADAVAALRRALEGRGLLKPRPAEQPTPRTGSPPPDAGPVVVGSAQ
jgi:patatin-related protein